MKIKEEQKITKIKSIKLQNNYSFNSCGNCGFGLIEKKSYSKCPECGYEFLGWEAKK